jgi:hypothetical protein
MPGYAFDHLAVVAPSLDAGAAHLRQATGIALPPGGRHAAMATWNRVGALTASEYLEVIAPDPAAPPPGRPRWFGLDAPGQARLAAWIVRVPDLDAAIAAAPWSAGAPVALTRGDLRWRFALCADGSLPMAGAAPLLIEWQTAPHPAGRMASTGHRLDRLAVSCPDPDPLAAWCARHLADPRIGFQAGPPGLSARLVGPQGMVSLR